MGKQQVKGITWFPENFQLHRPSGSPGHQTGSSCQELVVVQGPKMPMGLQSTSSTSSLSSFHDSGTYSMMVTSKKTSEPPIFPNICTQGTLQQVLKGLSKSKQRPVPTIAPPTKTENGVLDPDVSNLQPMNVQSLNEEEVQLPELSCSEDFSEGENSIMQFKSIHATEQCYPGIFPDFVEESKDVDENKTTFRCKLCKKMKPHRSGLIQHIESAHFPGTFIHTCKFCDKMLKTKSALNSHLHSCKNRFFQVNNNNFKN